MPMILFLNMCDAYTKETFSSVRVRLNI